LKRNWIIVRKPRIVFHAGAAFLLVSATALAAGTKIQGTKINGVTYDSSPGKGSGAKDSETPAPALPAAEHGMLPADQALRLKKIFLFPSIDDVSGALAPKLDEKLVDLLTRNTRFELVRDPQVIKALSPDESAYPKAAENQAVHREAAKVTGADTTLLLRTRNIGSTTEMTLQFRDAGGGLLFSESGTVPGSSTLEARWALIEKLFRTTLATLPFEGTVTGRTANTITIDLGSGFSRQGEELEIARIVSIQRHPLLGTVVGTDYVRTGKARVTNVDKVMSFADITEEFTGEKIYPGEKVLLARASLIHRPQYEGESAEKRPAAKAQPSEEHDEFSERIKGDFDQKKARYGTMGLDLAYGSLTQSQSTGGASPADYAGSGFGGTASGELWVTREFIFSLLYGFHSAKLGGNGVTLGSTSYKDFEGFIGYRIHPDSIAEGLEITGALGYQSMKFGLPTVSAISVSGKSYSGIALHVDAEVAFLKGQKLNAGITISPFASLSDDGNTLGSPDSGSVIGFNLGWNYLLADSLWLRLGLRYDAANGSYAGNSVTVSDKRFAIGPGIYYSF
jgi:hypothetical protein